MIVSGTMAVVLMAPLAALACWFDITQRRLPNWLVLATLSSGVVLALLGSGVSELPSRVGHVAIALVIGMGLYRMGLVGAGDAKFYAAVAVWFRLAQAFDLLLGVSVFGFLFALFWIALRGLFKPGAPNSKTTEKKKLPFGVAIAGGAFAALLLSM